MGSSRAIHLGKGDIKENEQDFRNFVSVPTKNLYDKN
jgi:hypothetical protein